MAAGALSVIAVASEFMSSIGAVQDTQRAYNDRMLGVVRFFKEFGGDPQSVMEDVKMGMPLPRKTESDTDTGALYGDWVAPRIESVNVPALLAALPGRLPTLQSLVEFLGTGRVLQVIEQRGKRYFLTGPGVGYVEITQTVERIRSDPCAASTSSPAHSSRRRTARASTASAPTTSRSTVTRKAFASPGECDTSTSR